VPAVVVFVVSALAIALSAGFGLGLWLLLARTAGLPTFGIAWPVLVQVHGTIQLFGFAAMFLMGVGLHVLPRFRGAAPPHRALVALAFSGTLGAIAIRAVAQPFLALPGRDLLLMLSGILLVSGTAAFAVGALRALRGGSNPHRPDELVIAAGVLAAPLAAILIATGMPLRGAPPLVDQLAADRAIWAMLLGSLGTAIFGVWARLAPGFIAAPPARPDRLIGGASLWLVGVAGLVAGVPFAATALLAGLITLVSAVGVFGASIARQRLPEHARATRLAVRSAFGWALVGAALLVAYEVRTAAAGANPSYLEISAVRHAFGLGFVTLMIYGVAARALPSFVDRRLWSERLRLVVIALANAGVALRVVPQAIGADGAAANGLIAASGVLAYLALVAFSVNIVQTLRGPALALSPRGVPVPMAVRFE
jgi:uncharacterized protein involved in response to NO